LDHCRKRAIEASPDHIDALVLLAILGKPQDLPRILALGQAEQLGPRRFEILGAYGHPAVIEPLADGF